MLTLSMHSSWQGSRHYNVLSLRFHAIPSDFYGHVGYPVTKPHTFSGDAMQVLVPQPAAWWRVECVWPCQLGGLVALLRGTAWL